MGTIFDKLNANVDLSVFKKGNEDLKTQLRRRYLSLVGLLEYVDIINGDLTGRELPEGMTEDTVKRMISHCVGDLDTIAAMTPAAITPPAMTTRSSICHDSDICKPGTANDATYTKINDFEMIVSGNLEHDTEHRINGNASWRFGLAIQIDEKYEAGATWRINEKDMELVTKEMDSNDPLWPRAIYIYPAFNYGDHNIYLADTKAEKLTVKIHYKDGVEETYIIKYYQVSDEN